MAAGASMRDPVAVEWLQPPGTDPSTLDRSWVERFLGHDPGWNRTAIVAAAQVEDPAWISGAGALVVAGQQPAFAGGPLYGAVKAAQAIALARRLDGPSRPVRACFWVAGEDHDTGEAGHADLVLRNGRTERLHAELGSGQQSLRFRSADRGWKTLIDCLADRTGRGLGAAWIEDHAPRRDENLSAWQARLLRALFQAEDLLVVEAHVLRPLWTSRLTTVCREWPREALAQRRREILARGYADALGELASPPLFDDQSQGRRALTSDQALDLIGTHADRLSPGAGLRPVLQQAALPAAAFIAGPGELAYHAFLGPIYRALDVPRPILVPRWSTTLAPRWWRSACAAWQVDPASVIAGQTPPALEESPLDLTGLDRALEVLANAPLADDLHPRRQAALRRLRRDRDRFATSLSRGLRQRSGRPAWGWVEHWAHPSGRPQDRVLPLVQAIWEFGPGLATLLVAAADQAGPEGHGIVPV